MSTDERVQREPTEGPRAGSSEVEEALRRERDARIAQLEVKLSRPRGVGLSPLSALVALVVSGWLFFEVVDDATYYFSSRVPVELGVEGSYRFDGATDNRYARIHGSPAQRATYWREGSVTHVAVRLREAPVLVKRRALPSEAWAPGEVPRPPDPRPFEVTGRLRSRGAEARHEAVFAAHDKLSDLSPALWLLDSDDRPGGDLGAALWAGLLAAAGCFSLWLLVRSVVSRSRLTR